ncbi:MAG TPA: HdeD family acid-resistance protein [Acidimicrobiales bacterium]|jgi:uncharacterized membrane protein HdeD (DUF308 family)|nr:HdeD family acid-resistance protein [Acidimicrobiales bacterium]
MTEVWRARWWVLVVRGAAAVVFGMLALGWPDITPGTLATLFGAYALVDGLTTLLVAATCGRLSDRWTVALEGAMSVLAAGAALLWPDITERSLLLVIATWAIATGVWELVAAVRLRREVEHEWLMGLAGLASVLAGLSLAARSGADVIAITLLIGFYSLTFGCLLFALGLRIHGLERPSDVVDLTAGAGRRADADAPMEPTRG